MSSKATGRAPMPLPAVENRERVRREEARRPMTLREWTGPRDGRHWTIWLDRGKKPVLAFASEGGLYTVVVDFTDRLEDRSDEDLGRLLDKGRGT